MWEEGEYSKIVLSTKIMFGRNISGYPFPNRFSSEKREEFRSYVEHHFQGLQNIRWSLWQKLPHQQKRLAMERKMLSGQQALGEIGFLGMDSLENSYFFTEFYNHFDFIGLAGGWNWTSASFVQEKSGSKSGHSIPGLDTRFMAGLVRIPYFGEMGFG